MTRRGVCDMAPGRAGFNIQTFREISSFESDHFSYNNKVSRSDW